MKCDIRFKILVGVVSFITAVILLAVLEDKCETYDPISYIQFSLPNLNGEDQAPAISVPVVVGDKILVVPTLEDYDFSWVSNDLPDWQHAVYIVNPSEKTDRTNTLTTPLNKGHEGMAYLTYIIDNYESSIPSVVAFLHSHRGGFFEAWHVDTPLHDNVVAMKHLQLDFVKKNGYVNLRCNWNPGCKKQSGSNSLVGSDVWDEIFYATSTPGFNPNSNSSAAVADMSGPGDKAKYLFENMPIWTPCCGQFAVSRERIYERPLEDYIKIRQWLIETEKTDAQSGRVLEYLWHVIFGMEATYCPIEDTCYCQVYGRC